MKPSEREQWADWLADREAGRPEKPPAKTHRRTPSELEHEIQRTFIDWCRIMEGQIPELVLMHAIPNGGWRHPAVGGKLKAEGVLSGIPDLHLPVAREPWKSLYLEVKAPGGSLSRNQVDRIRELRAHHNVVAVCFGVEELITITTSYLKGRVTDVTGAITGDRA